MEPFIKTLLKLLTLKPSSQYDTGTSVTYRAVSSAEQRIVTAHSQSSVRSRIQDMEVIFFNEMVLKCKITRVCIIMS